MANNISFSGSSSQDISVPTFKDIFTSSTNGVVGNNKELVIDKSVDPSRDFSNSNLFCIQFNGSLQPTTQVTLYHADGIGDAIFTNLGLSPITLSITFYYWLDVIHNSGGYIAYNFRKGVADYIVMRLNVTGTLRDNITLRLQKTSGSGNTFDGRIVMGLYQALLF